MQRLWQRLTWWEISEWEGVRVRVSLIDINRLKLTHITYDLAILSSSERMWCRKSLHILPQNLAEVTKIYIGNSFMNHSFIVTLIYVTFAICDLREIALQRRPVSLICHLTNHFSTLSLLIIQLPDWNTAAGVSSELLWPFLNGLHRNVTVSYTHG